MFCARVARDSRQKTLNRLKPFCKYFFLDQTNSEGNLINLMPIRFESRKLVVSVTEHWVVVVQQKITLKMAYRSLSRVSSILSNRSYFTYSNQISQPLERTPPYVEAREAVACIKSGKKLPSNRKSIKRIGLKTLRHLQLPGTSHDHPEQTNKCIWFAKQSPKSHKHWIVKQFGKINGAKLCR